jgi:hypothetical protein
MSTEMKEKNQRNFTGHWWLTPVILVLWEAENWRIEF